jgi:peptidoglycan/LPS O-acetylase OafA/YrhL
MDARESPHYYRDFFARRVLRIFPLYFGALLLLVVVFPGLGLVPGTWRDEQLWYWLYLSNWTQPYTPGPLPHFWSLAVEEQFYLLWPFVVLRLEPRSLLPACLWIAAASLVLRCLMLAMGVFPEAVYMFSHARMDALVLGAAAAVILRHPASVPPLFASPARLWRAAVVIGVVGLGLTRAYPRGSVLGQTLGYTLLAVVFALAVLALALEDTSGQGGWIARILRSAPLRANGRYSYGMYVWHKPLHDLVGKPTLESLGLGPSLPLAAGLAYVGVGIAVTFGVGMASYWLFERHFLALKERFAPRGPRGPG